MPKIWDASVAEHKVRVREAIMDAAVDLAAERGRQDVTMSAVAERAELGRATVYNYFPDVDHILGAYVVSAFEHHAALLDRRLAEVADPLEGLRTALGLTIAYFASDEHARGSSVGLENFAPEVQRQVHAVTQDLQARFARLIGDAKEAGLVRDDLDVGFAADALHHMLGVARTAVLGGGASPDEVTDDLFRLFVEGSGTARARRRRAR